MGSDIKIVLAGIGGYGANYIRSLLSGRHQGARLTGLVDPAPQNSPAYPLVAGLPVYPDLASFYSRQQADLALIASPIQYHAGQIICALENRSSVLCEKPLCATLEQGQSVLAAQQASGLQVGIGYQWSFQPAILRARADVQAGRYGRPEVFRTRVYWPRNLAYYSRNSWAGRIFTADGLPVFDSVLNNATAHYLHNMLFFLGRYEQDAAMPDKVAGRLYRAHAIESFDTVLLRLEKDWPGGPPVVLAMAASHCTENLRGPELDYRFSGGRIFLQDGHLIGICGSGESDEMIDYGPTQDEDAVGNKLAAMLAAVRSGRRPVCDVRTALPQTAVVAALHAREPITALPAGLIRRISNADGEWLAVAGLADWLDQGLESLRLPDHPLAAPDGMI